MLARCGGRGRCANPLRRPIKRQTPTALTIGVLCFKTSIRDYFNMIDKDDASIISFLLRFAMEDKFARLILRATCVVAFVWFLVWAFTDIAQMLGF